MQTIRPGCITNLPSVERRREMCQGVLRSSFRVMSIAALCSSCIHCYFVPSLWVHATTSILIVLCLFKLARKIGVGHHQIVMSPIKSRAGGGGGSYSTVTELFVLFALAAFIVCLVVVGHLLVKYLSSCCFKKLSTDGTAC